MSYNTISSNNSSQNQKNIELINEDNFYLSAQNLNDENASNHMKLIDNISNQSNNDQKHESSSENKNIMNSSKKDENNKSFSDDDEIYLKLEKSSSSINTTLINSNNYINTNNEINNINNNSKNINNNKNDNDNINDNNSKGSTIKMNLNSSIKETITDSCPESSNEDGCDFFRLFGFIFCFFLFIFEIMKNKKKKVI